MMKELKKTSPLRWSVREDGNKVIIEFTCRDNYEAILLGETIGDGMRSGSLEIEFEHWIDQD